MVSIGEFHGDFRNRCSGGVQPTRQYWPTSKGHPMPMIDLRISASFRKEMPSIKSLERPD